MKITLEHYITKITIEMPNDSDMRSVTDAVKGMLIASGWGIELVKEYLGCPKESDN